MPRINHIGGVQAPPYLDDRFLLAGLGLVCLAHFGNVYASQAFVMVLCAFAGLCFILRDRIIAAAGAYLSIWYAYLYSSATAGLIPVDIQVQAVDSLNLLTGVLIIYAGIRNGSTPVERWLDAICSLAIVLSLIGIVQFIKVGSASATLACTNFLAAFLAVSAPCFYRRKWWMALPVVLVCLWLTNTSTAIAAFLVATGFYFLGWWGVGLSAVPALLYFLIFKAPDSLFERLAYWSDALSKLAGEKLILGTGPGILWTPGNTLHSEYASLLWNLGLLGIVLAGLYIWRSIRITVDRRITAAVLAVLVDGFGNHLLHTAPTAFLAVAVFALNDRSMEA